MKRVNFENNLMIFITLETCLPPHSHYLITVSLLSSSVHTLHRSLSVSLRIVYCYLAVVLGGVHVGVCPVTLTSNYNGCSVCCLMEILI